MAGNLATYQAAMRQGHTLAWELKWEAASREYRRALAERPDDAAASVSLAVALAKLGDNHGALEMYRHAVTLLPDDAPALVGLAEIELKVGNLGAAAESFARLIALYLTRSQLDRARQMMLRLADLPSPAASVLREIVAASARVGADDLATWADEAIQRATSEESEIGTGVARPATPPRAEPVAPSEIGAPTTNDRQPARGLPPPVAAILAAIDEVEHRRATGDRSGIARSLAQLRAAGGDWCIHPEELLDVAIEVRAVVAEAMLQSAEDLRARRVVGARDACLSAIGTAAGYLPAQIRLAEVDVESGQSDAAVHRLEAVFDLYSSQNRGKSAASTFGWILQLRANDPTLRERLVDLYLAEGLTDQAVDQLGILVADAVASGDTRRALQLLERAIVIQPTNLELWIAHFERLVADEQWARASERAGEMRAYFPSDPRARGVFLAARAWSDDLVAIDQVIAEIGDEVADAARPASAWLDETRHLLNCGPSEDARQYALGRLLYAADDPAAGRLLLAESALSPARPALTSALFLAQIAREATNAADERRWTERAIELSESVEGGHGDRADREHTLDGLRVRLAVVCGELGDVAARARVLESLAASNPDEDAYFAQLAECYFQLGDVRHAAAMFTELANLYDRKGDPTRALGADQARLALTPEDPELLARLGDRYFALDLGAEGETSYREATKSAARLGRRDDAARYLRVLVAFASHHDQRRALAYREQLAKIAPNDWAGRRDLAAAYLKLGRASRAFAEYRAVAIGLSASGDWSTAATVFDEALKLNPWDTAVLLDLAKALLSAGLRDDAHRRVEQLLALNPSDRSGLELLEQLESTGAGR